MALAFKKRRSESKLVSKLVPELVHLAQQREEAAKRKVAETEGVFDAAIERGGCRVQTRFGETDATLQTRWAELTRALGRDTAWLVSERAEAERVAGGALHVA